MAPSVPHDINDALRTVEWSGLGNENIHLLTTPSRMVLRVDLIDDSGNGFYAEYDNFVLADETTSYSLISLGTSTGTAGN